MNIHTTLHRIPLGYTKDAIEFKLDRKEIVYTKKDVIQYPRFTKLIIADLMKKFTSIHQQLKEDYHSMKDDIMLVSVYSTGNVTVRGMLIPDAFLTDEIRATDDYKEYETVFVKFKPSTTSIPPLGHDQERDEMAEATLPSLTLHITALSAKAQENVALVQEKLEDEEINKMVKGEGDDESDSSVFADLVFNDDDDDSSNKIEPGSRKENPKVVVDDDVNDNEKKDEKKDDDDEKNDDA
ncbi:hypothetical protein Tco_0622803 [Tanacetum coccineum]